MRLWNGRFARVACAWLAALMLASAGVRAQDPQAAQPTFKPEEIEALVAPIALYPDSLLSQVLMASTYPLEIVYAARWLKANPNVKGEAAIKAVESQPWDVSVKSLLAFPAGARADERQARLDAEAGRCLPGAAEGGARRGAAPARQGAADGQPQDQRAAEGDRGAGDGTGSRRGRPSCGSSRPNPQVIYVPTYNPTMVYGCLGLSGVPAVLLGAVPGLLPGYYPGTALATGLAWGIGFAAAGRHLRQLQLGWRRRRHQRQPGHQHRPQLRPQQGAERRRWQHDASHRQGVAYRDNATREKFGRAGVGRRRHGGRDGARCRARRPGRGGRSGWRWVTRRRGWVTRAELGTGAASVDRRRR